MLKPETVERALGAIKGYAQSEYFFDHLNSPAWLKPLADRGFFKHPQPAERVDPYIRFRFWPESRYLVRMSKILEAQPAVLEIALEIPPSDNSRIYDDLAEIAFSLPPESGARLVPKLLEGVRLPVKLLLKERIGEIIPYLADGGQGEAAKALAMGVLALSPDPDAGTKEEESLLFPEPRTLFEDFYYRRIVAKALPALVRALGIDAIRMFADLLDEAIRFSQKGDYGANGEDYLYVAHPAIETGGGRDDIPGILLYALRDAAEQFITADPGQLMNVLEVLKLKRWSSFKRVKLHLCRGFLEAGGLDIAEKAFQDPEILNHPSLHHEAVLLLKASFTHLSATSKECLLEWVDRGRPEDASRRWLELSGQEVSEENIRQLSDIWRRDHFAILQGQLPEPYQRKLDELVARTGPARKLEEPQVISGGAFGAVSPKAPGEFSTMSVAEILDFLATWTPGTDFLEATAEGAGQALGAAIGGRLDEFVAEANEFRRLDPTYVRSFFGAITGALKEKRVFDWKPVLDLAAWVSSQPREIPGKKGGGLFIADPDWGWSRDAIIDLLSAGFDGDLDGRLSFDLRAMVWDALRPLTDDPNLTPEDEAPDPEKSSSPLIRRFAAKDERAKEPDLTSISINTTRGRAMHAVFRYAQWVRLCIDKQRTATEGPTIGLDVMTEVREVLDAHLDLGREPTRTIRSVYGNHLTVLALLDGTWLEANLSRILPLDDLLYPFFRAAWSSFIVFNQPNTTLLKLLTPCYRKAIQHLGKDIIPRNAVRSPEDALAEHLMAYYWRDELDFGGIDQLLDDFYVLASGKVRGHAIWYIGISVPGWKEEAPPEVYLRLQRLFDKRLEAAMNAATPEMFSSELANFSFWFTSDKFDERWSIETLLAALRLCKKTASEMDVVKRLAEICPRYPAECVSCLRLMFEGDSEASMVIGVEEHARALLRQALHSDHADAANSAKRLIENLIGKGHSGFRTLLSESRA
jgi:hypothetical protein